MKPIHLAVAGLVLLAPAMAVAQDKLDSPRSEIEGALKEQAGPPLDPQNLPSRPDRDSTSPAPSSQPYRTEDQSSVDTTKPSGFEPVSALPRGYTGPTAKIAVGTIASAVVNMTANSDYPGPWRATLSQPLMNIDRSAVIAPTGSTLVGISQRA